MKTTRYQCLNRPDEDGYECPYRYHPDPQICQNCWAFTTWHWWNTAIPLICWLIPITAILLLFGWLIH